MFKNPTTGPVKGFRALSGGSTSNSENMALPARPTARGPPRVDGANLTGTGQGQWDGDSGRAIVSVVGSDNPIFPHARNKTKRTLGYDRPR